MSKPNGRELRVSRPRTGRPRTGAWLAGLLQAFALAAAPAGLAALAAGCAGDGAMTDPDPDETGETPGPTPTPGGGGGRTGGTGGGPGTGGQGTGGGGAAGSAGAGGLGGGAAGAGGQGAGPDAAAKADGGADAGDPAPPPPDAGASDSKPGPGEPAPTMPGKAAAFVAAGNGGRTVTSCDDGKTWIAQEIVLNTNDDHSPYTHKGFAYGDGTFVHVSGWGTHARIKRSTDGVTWTKSELPGYSFGGVGFSDGAFVGVDSFGSRVSRDGGKSWQTGGRSNHGYHVRGVGGGGRAVAGGGSDMTPVTTWDQGKTFAKATGCPGMDFSNLGQRGGAAFGAGGLVIMSAKGDFCRLVDGKVVKAGNVGGSVAGKVAWVNDRFMAPSGGRAFVSKDGETWSAVTFKPAGLAINIVARGASGTYVGITQGATGFFRSEDGETWEKINGPSGPRLVDLAFGWVTPSGMCPAR
jgi:hypothetical protein